MNEIQVSIIIPIFNLEEYIVDCLESIYMQKNVTFEVICINDGSVDNSKDIIEQYAIDKENLILYSQDNEGQSSARNKGLTLAKGKYIYFLDGDDKIAHEDDLSFIIYEMEKEQLDFLEFDGKSFFSNECMHEKNKEYDTMYIRKKAYGRYDCGKALFHDLNQEVAYYCSPSLRVYRRDFLVQNDLFFKEGIVFEDNLHTLACFMLAKDVKHINRAILLRRIREESTIQAQKTPRFFHFLSLSIVYLSILELWKNIKDACIDEDIERLCTSMRDSANILWRRLSNEERDKIKGIDKYVQYSIKNNIFYQSYTVNGFIFPYHLFIKTRPIWIYGAGSIGKEFYYQLKEQSLLDVAGIVDKIGSSASDGFINVLGLDSINEHIDDTWLIAIEDEKIAKEAKSILMNKGVPEKNILWDGCSYSRR
ncbi:glycosyltransferase family 2 protein [Pseudobutyrivibrio xylanivorans]|uniref:Glycosyltransferase involved in cell wall bisynthesis n=1 Tax=Pseudobutyrivibrio xylanivorans TaxID=185007 RepID=A0A1G5RQ10_PSEXY|nr:glycosyltransferase family 2 protein [Pseudobutyrivibrio xylanivorans]SCZ76084.1 Glycosyltransferase involved in cell wall bisynthesis [Pseudobutyrivibrio xylanivorans]